MSEDECQLCNRDGQDLRTLTHDEASQTVQACPRCLRDHTRAKASRSDQRARAFMQDKAKDSPLEVWRREHVVYLLDPIQATPPREEEEKIPAGRGSPRSAPPRQPDPVKRA